MIEVQLVGGGEDRDVAAEVADELRLVPDGQRTHVGVQPISPHNEVEGSLPSTLEGDPYTVIVLGEGGNGVVEDVLDLVPGRLYIGCGSGRHA